MAQKLWEKNVQVDHEVDIFTVGKDREMDLYLAKYDVLGSMAHITMLESIGLLTKEELNVLLAELRNIYAVADRGEFIIEEGIEDVHSQVELMLTRRLGDMGKKIHSGRSRNDQVLLDLKLFTRSQIQELVELVSGLFDVLISQSNRYKDVLLPGYTHLQVAMPSSFGLWFGAYAESFRRRIWFILPAKPPDDYGFIRFRLAGLQCGIRPDGTWQDGTHRGFRYGGYRRYALQVSVRRLYVQ